MNGQILELLDYAEDLNSLDFQVCICLNTGLDPTQSVGKNIDCLYHSRLILFHNLKLEVKIIHIGPYIFQVLLPVEFRSELIQKRNSCVRMVIQDI